MIDILGALAVAKQVIDLSKELRNIDGKINESEFKYKISDLIDHVLEVRSALLDAQEREFSLKREITDLKEKAATRARMRDQNGLLYEVSEEGEKVGEPFCNLCFVKDEKLYRMRHHDAKPGTHSYFRCDNCKTSIVTGPVLPIQAPQRNRSSWQG